MEPLATMYKTKTKAKRRETESFKTKLTPNWKFFNHTTRIDSNAIRSNRYTHVFEKVQQSNGTSGNDVQSDRKWKI